MSRCNIARVAVSAATYWVDRPYDYMIPSEFEDKVSPGMRVIVPFSKGNRRVEGVVLAINDKSGYDKLKSIMSVLDMSPVLTEQQLQLALWMRDRFFCTVYDAVRAILPSGFWFTTSTEYRIADNCDKDTAILAAGRSEKRKKIIDIIFDCGGRCDQRGIERAAEMGDCATELSFLTKKGVLVTEGREKPRTREKTQNMALLMLSGEEALIIAAQKRRSAPLQAAVLELLAAIGRASVKELCYFTGASSATIKKLLRDGIISVEPEQISRRPTYKTLELSDLPKLSHQQKDAFEGILALDNGGSAGAALLFGVTGSGKTSVYMHLIDEMLKRGRSSILMVPEIALTPQLLEAFSSKFGDNIALLHSNLSIGERYDEWNRVRMGDAGVIIGTRSAVFAPCENLGLIIIDEEQEGAYKSENNPRYHARDIAKYRCSREGARLLLGSATPDIESMYNAQTGKYAFFKLDKRYNLMDMPSVQIVDMKRELRQGNGGNISLTLLKELETNISRGEQSILFLNRRGAYRLITCIDCGFTYSCPRCSVSLIYHSAGKRLMCHYCGHSGKVGDECPECGGNLTSVGAGTQKLEEELRECLPGAEVLRMDADTVSPAGSHEALLSRFSEKKIPILVGTQMVTKGLNFESVTLVGVISADQSLYSGDYRSAERTFSLITQVVGRSGRGGRPGRAVIQTFTPENQTILQAAKQDYESFYQSEIVLRKMAQSPPFSELFTITATGLDESAVLRCCIAVRAMLQNAFADDSGARILGPAPLFVVRINNRFRYRVMLACRGGKRVREFISDILISINKNKEFKGVSVFADYNPAD